MSICVYMLLVCLLGTWTRRAISEVHHCGYPWSHARGTPKGFLAKSPEIVLEVIFCVYVYIQNEYQLLHTSAMLGVRTLEFWTMRSAH